MPNIDTQLREYTVSGMTCSHCAVSVREEVAELPGVRALDVDLASGRLAVSGADVDERAVRAAVAEAGYAVLQVTRCELSQTPGLTIVSRSTNRTPSTGMASMRITSYRLPVAN